MVHKNLINDSCGDLILIPTDFSAICENAVNHGIELASILKYKVCLLHVVNRNKRPYVHLKSDRAFSILQKLNAIKTRCESRYPVEIEILAKNGNLPEIIEQVTVSRKAEFMILGINRKHKSLQYMGHHALKIAGDAPCPVINIQEKPLTGGYKTIIVPVQSEKIAEQIMRYLALYHKLFSSAIHVFLDAHNGTVKSVSGNAMKDEISGIFKSANIPVSVETADRNTDFAEQILSISAKMKADIIIAETIPEFNASGKRVSLWNEQMIFNENQIAVMTVNPVRHR